MFFSYNIDTTKYTAALRLMAPSETMQLVINTGITYSDRNANKVMELLEKINGKMFGAEFIPNKINNTVTFTCGLLYKLRGRAIFESEEAFCKAMAMPLVYMNEIKAAAEGL